jgi:16S rRNA (cytidine1402-2'-O)-methyltransferase
MENKGKLFLIPVSLGDENAELISAFNKKIISGLDVFIVENAKSARHFLRSAGFEKAFDEVIFFEINKHESDFDNTDFLKSIDEGKNIGLLSEAGCPGVADPGAEIVELAHRKKIQVVPLIGASSILLGLMACGFNGQQFAFHGYLPIEKSERIKKIRGLEKESVQKNQTQIFIETPYRNNVLLEALLQNCLASTQLCVGVNLTLPDEKIISQTISAWKKSKHDFNKQPAVFVLYSK